MEKIKNRTGLRDDYYFERICVYKNLMNRRLNIRISHKQKSRKEHTWVERREIPSTLIGKMKIRKGMRLIFNFSCSILTVLMIELTYFWWGSDVENDVKVRKIYWKGKERELRIDDQEFEVYWGVFKSSIENGLFFPVFHREKLPILDFK